MYDIRHPARIRLQDKKSPLLDTCSHDWKEEANHQPHHTDISALEPHKDAGHNGNVTETPSVWHPCLPIDEPQIRKLLQIAVIRRSFLFVIGLNQPPLGTYLLALEEHVAHHKQQNGDSDQAG